MPYKLCKISARSVQPFGGHSRKTHGGVASTPLCGRGLSVVREMSFGSFGTKNSMVTFFFKFDPRNGQLQVKLGQIRPNFEIKIFLQNMPFLCSFASGFQKCRLLLCTAIKNAKKCLSNMWRHHLYLFFFAIAQPKTLWNFVCVLFVCISIPYIPFFFRNGKIWIL